MSVEHKTARKYPKTPLRDFSNLFHALERQPSQEWVMPYRLTFLSFTLITKHSSLEFLKKNEQSFLLYDHTLNLNKRLWQWTSQTQSTPSRLSNRHDSPGLSVRPHPPSVQPSEISFHERWARSGRGKKRQTFPNGFDWNPVFLLEGSDTGDCISCCSCMHCLLLVPQAPVFTLKSFPGEPVRLGSLPSEKQISSKNTS